MIPELAIGTSQTFVGEASYSVGYFSNLGPQESTDLVLHTNLQFNSGSGQKIDVIVQALFAPGKGFQAPSVSYITGGGSISGATASVQPSGTSPAGWNVDILLEPNESYYVIQAYHQYLIDLKNARGSGNSSQAYHQYLLNLQNAWGNVDPNSTPNPMSLIPK